MGKKKKKGKGGAAAPVEKKELLICSADIRQSMRDDAINCTKMACTKYNNVMDIAAYIKKGFDQKYGARWQCAVGRDFGSCVNYDQNNFIHFYIKDFAVLLFKT